MKIKNEEGNILLIVMITMSILMILGATLISIIGMENKMSHRYDRKTQAYYYARSGIEYALQVLEESDYFGGNLNVGFPKDTFSSPKYFNGDINSGFSEGQRNNRIVVSITENDKGLTIHSQGFVDGFKETVTLVLPKISGGEEGGGPGGRIPSELIEPALQKAVYSLNNISLSGSAKIVGDVVTNGNVILDNSGSKVHGLVTSNANHTFNFPLPTFPEFPALPNRGELTANWHQNVTINEDGYYSKITVFDKLHINTGESGNVREIRVGKLIMGDNGHIIVTGNGRLVIYVDDQFTGTSGNALSRSASVNNKGVGGGSNLQGDPNALVVFYKGNTALNFGGNFRMAGSIYSQNTDFNFTSSAMLSGIYITGGRRVDVDSSSHNILNRAVIYAPNADLRIVSGAGIHGLVFVNSVVGTGNSTISFGTPENLNLNLIWGNQGGGSGGYDRPIWGN